MIQNDKNEDPKSGLKKSLLLDFHCIIITLVYGSRLFFGQPVSSMCCQISG